ncbi:MAG: aspartate kinase [Desulfurococcaceae archaeon]
MKEYVVVKIGGSILRDAKSYVINAQKVVELFIERGLRPFIVISAMKGITDSLLKIANGYKNEIENIESKYLLVANEVGSCKLIKRVEKSLNDLRRIVENVNTYTPALRDLILSFGEKLSKTIFADMLENMGVKTIEIDAADIIVTDNNHGDANIDYDRTLPRLEKIYRVAREHDAVVVIEGFIGSNINGVITTLGRGGSDYTATSIASLLGLKDIYLVTDVDGIMTADPRVVPTARVVDDMSYAEALEASLYNVKGINCKSFDPLIRRPGPRVLIGSWEKFGTKIIEKTSKEGPKVITNQVINKRSRIALIGNGVSKAIFIKEIMDYLVSHGIEINELQTSSERPSLIMTISGNDHLKIIRNLHDYIFYGCGI